MKHVIKQAYMEQKFELLIDPMGLRLLLIKIKHSFYTKTTVSNNI
jgi:hypothetical protein